MSKPTEKLTLAQLRAREDIDQGDRDRMEEVMIRLIQIQEEARRLEVEKGYIKDKKRVRGIADELEDLFIKWDVVGVKVEDYTVRPTHGCNSWIDKGVLLAEGVTADVINAATRESHWTGIGVFPGRDSRE